ncbi:MAG: energy transducer TonB, partial [Lysobacteraceae bacterium]
MAEQLVINRYRDEEPGGLNWPRIIGMAFVIALHVAAFLLLLIPAVAPPAEKEQEQKTLVTIVDPPKP